MEHEVRVRINTAVISHKDLKVSVRTNGAKLGTILISKGNIEWVPRGNSVNKRRMSWTQFAEVMEREGKRRKIQRPGPTG